jgi:hypothetical protein
MAGRRFGTTTLGEEQVRVTVRLPKALYDNLATLSRRRFYGRYLMLGEVIRRALTHYVECPEGLSKESARLENLPAILSGAFSRLAQLDEGSLLRDTPPQEGRKEGGRGKKNPPSHVDEGFHEPVSTPLPTWKLGIVAGALKLWHTQHPDTSPTHEAIHAICGKTLSTDEIDAILDTLKRSGDYDRLFAS